MRASVACACSTSGPLSEIFGVPLTSRSSIAARCARSSVAPLRIGRAGIHVLFPIAREPVEDRDPCRRRRLAAEHQIDFERLIDEGRVVDVLLDLLFEPQARAAAASGAPAPV